MKRSLFLILFILILSSFAGCSRLDGPDGPEEEKIIDLDVPSGVRLDEFGDISIKMAWEPVDDAEYYVWKVIAKVIHNDVAVDSVVAMGETFNTFKTIYDLDPECEPNGYNYWFSVAAGAGTLSRSAYSDPVRCEPGGLTPLVPGKIRQSAVSEFGFTFEWDPAECADYYHYRLMTPKGEIIREGDVAETRKTFDGLKKGRYYYISVSGANALKSSPFSERVEGLTFGEYLPAIIFNASFSSGDFFFTEGQELYITDGTRWAGYVVKSTGSATTLELTTDEEVESGKVYHAYMPAALHDNSIFDAGFTARGDGKFTGVPARAVSSAPGDTDLRFNSYYSLVEIEVSSEKRCSVSSMRVSSDIPMSGYVTGADGPSISFSRSFPGAAARADGGITVEYPEPLVISSTPTRVVVPVLSGIPGNASVVYKDQDNSVISGHLLDSRSFLLKTVSSVTEVTPSGEDFTMIGSLTVESGEVEDFDMGFLALPYGETDWNLADFIPGSIFSRSGKTVVFRAGMQGYGCRYIRACAKAKGANVSVASSGPVSFFMLMDFRNNGSTAAPCPRDLVPNEALESETRFGEPFPVARVACNEGEKYPLTTFLFDGFPISITSTAMSSNRKYSIYWDIPNQSLDSYKLRVILFPEQLPGFRPVYAYFFNRTEADCYVGTTNKYKEGVFKTGKTLSAGTSITTIPAGSKVYIGSDANGIGTYFIILWFTKI